MTLDRRRGCASSLGDPVDHDVHSCMVSWNYSTQAYTNCKLLLHTHITPTHTHTHTHTDTHTHRHRHHQLINSHPSSLPPSSLPSPSLPSVPPSIPPPFPIYTSPLPRLSHRSRCRSPAHYCPDPASCTAQ